IRLRRGSARCDRLRARGCVDTAAQACGSLSAHGVDDLDRRARQGLQALLVHLVDRVAFIEEIHRRGEEADDWCRWMKERRVGGWVRAARRKTLRRADHRD